MIVLTRPFHAGDVLSIGRPAGMLLSILKVITSIDTWLPSHALRVSKMKTTWAEWWIAWTCATFISIPPLARASLWCRIASFSAACYARRYLDRAVCIEALFFCPHSHCSSAERRLTAACHLTAGATRKHGHIRMEGVARRSQQYGWHYGDCRARAPQRGDKNP